MTYSYRINSELPVQLCLYPLLHGDEAKAKEVECVIQCIPYGEMLGRCFGGSHAQVSRSAKDPLYSHVYV
jgi:hypothetical protein